jgi:hypothetical protein
MFLASLVDARWVIELSIQKGDWPGRNTPCRLLLKEKDDYKRPREEGNNKTTLLKRSARVNYFAKK